MRIEANIAPVAALFAEPSRAAIMSVLLDGRALPAGELATLAGVSPTAASGHLTKLIDGGLLAVEVEGRHRYYRLANTGVVQVIEELALLTKEPAIFRTPPLPRAARALRHARSCYDHLAGELAVAIAAALENRGWLVRGEGKRYEFGKEEGRKWFARQGVNFQTITWSIRPVGARLFKRWCELGWLERDHCHARLVKVSALGQRSLRQELGLTFCNGLTVTLSQRISPQGFCLPQRHEGLPRSECRRDLQSQTAP
jgi:DNA-binding transcriptional ArsR family regulator